MPEPVECSGATISRTAAQAPHATAPMAVRVTENKVSAYALQGGGQEGDGVHGVSAPMTPSPPRALPLKGREPSPFTLHPYTERFTRCRETPDTTSSRHPRTASRRSRNPTDPTRATSQRARCPPSLQRVGTG